MTKIQQWYTNNCYPLNTLYIALPEKGFRIREFRAPDKTGGESSGSTGQENQLSWRLFDINPNLARKLFMERYRSEHPEWDEVKIAREVASGELTRKIEHHYELYKQFGETDERVQALEEEINFWRLVFTGF